VYVCTNISCSLRGADELYETLARAAGEEVNVRAFECLGACDIAPMASVDGVYVGPLSSADVPALLEDLRAGREVLPERQLVRRRVADPRANRRDFSERASGAGGARAGEQGAAGAAGAGEEPDGDGHD
jgi:hypothetical protein